MRARGRLLALVPVLAVCAAPLACSAILGVKDIYLADDAGSFNDLGSDDGAFRDIHPPATDAGADGSSADGGACSGIDLTKSATNCGACGHDCLGGTCDKGKCQPSVLVTGHPAYLTVDDTTIYYTDHKAGEVRARSKTSGAERVVCTTADSPNEIATDGLVAYFTFQGTAADGVAWCPLPGGVQPTVVGPNQTAPGSLVLIGSTAFWVQQPGSGPASVMRAPPDGGLPETVTTGDPSADVSLAVADGFLYIASWVANGTLTRCAPSGPCSPQTVAVNADGYYAVALNGGHLAWEVDSDQGAVWQGLPDGGSPARVAGNQPRPTSIAYDDAYLYWANSGLYNTTIGEYDNGAIMRCPRTGGVVDCGSGPETISTEPLKYVRSLVVDTNAVYWIDDTRLWRLAK